jgi:hypothetical protein
MNVCNNCRYWSEMCAQSIGCGPMEALCLKEHGPKQGRMTTERDSCPHWASNEHGAIDDPSGKWRNYADGDTANAAGQTPAARREQT